MLNLVFLIFIYGCVMLYNNVSNAVWSGLAVTALLYLQLALNFTFLLFEKGRRAGDSTDKSDTVKVDYELNQMKLGVDVEREPEFDELEHSENKSALEGQYENHFTVYEPTIKKPPLEIMINPPEMLYETNAINTAIKTFTGRSEKERLLLDKRQNYLVTPRPRKEVEEEIIDIGSKEVEMDAI
ncbi:hypothetical protein DAPPUDRAFT_339871 [Daphnia pulex]|uniref:Uncharacterized protein n=1 Tax=Daphnia pulex TaxID=6669 RepID=E9I3P6_DAPPU|nr:hypothetical protein DAPPUDRAFT_339871 [Daphnia pulex]|eukprot:EFX61384.1 hypothetical protein DAPPUDRAFT_339871 [Daphnia pulex]